MSDGLARTLQQQPGRASLEAGVGLGTVRGLEGYVEARARLTDSQRAFARAYGAQGAGVGVVAGWQMDF